MPLSRSMNKHTFTFWEWACPSQNRNKYIYIYVLTCWEGRGPFKIPSKNPSRTSPVREQCKYCCLWLRPKLRQDAENQYCRGFVVVVVVWASFALFVCKINLRGTVPLSTSSYTNAFIFREGACPSPYIYIYMRLCTFYFLLRCQRKEGPGTNCLTKCLLYEHMSNIWLTKVTQQSI